MNVQSYCQAVVYGSACYFTVMFFREHNMTSLNCMPFVLLLLESLAIWQCTSDTKTGQGNRSLQLRPKASTSLMFVLLLPLCSISETMASRNATIGKAEIIYMTRTVARAGIPISRFLLLSSRLKSACCLLVLAIVMVHLCEGLSVSFIVTSCIMWKLLQLVPQIIPKSFSFAEMAITLQLLCPWMANLMDGLAQMDEIVTDEQRVKWLASAVVLAVLTATVIVYLVRAFRSLLLFILVYACHAVLFLIFLHVSFKQSPLLWLINFSLSGCTRILLLAGWVVLFFTAIIWAAVQALQNPNFPLSRPSSVTLQKQEILQEESVTVTEDSSQALFNMRKVFHFFILLVYIPGLLLDPLVLLLASAAVFAAFILLEAMRAMQVPFVSHHLDQVLRMFVDDRDQGTIFVTHIYLLVGLSIPLWISSGPLTSSPTAFHLFSGVLCLGVGDTVACVVGTALGRHRWSGTKKTVEGTVSSIIAQIIFMYTILSTNQTAINHNLSPLLGIVANALVESFTDQIDNLILTLVTFPFFCVAT